MSHSYWQRGLDEKDNRVRIGIDEVSYSNVKQLLTQRFRVLGIDTTLIRLVSEQVARPTSTASLRNRDTPAATSLTAMWGAMVGGILIPTTGADPKAGGASPASCSAGFAANHTPAGSPTYRAIVTATHCTTVWGAPDGTSFSQGGVFGGFSEVDPDKYRCGYNWCRASDAALFKLDASMPSEVGLIARTTSASSGAGAGSTAVDPFSPYFVVTGTALPPVGATYHKMGFAGGWTTDVKWQSCIDHKLGNGLDQYVTRCADRGTAFNTGGDSGGSVFVRLDSNNVALIGTTVGQGGNNHVWSLIGRIESDMGGVLGVVRDATLSSPTVTAAVLGSGYAEISWPPVSGATEYRVTVDNYSQTCDEWGCYVTGMREESTVTGGTFTDSRSYLYVIPPGTPSTAHVSMQVVARNPLLGSRSIASDAVRFAKDF